MEIFCFGFDPINTITGKIFDIQIKSLNKAYEQETSIDYCDILLASIDNENIIPISIPTNILITFPDLSILPKK